MSQIEIEVEFGRTIYTATEEALTVDWDRKENLQFPHLLNMVIGRLSLNAKEATDVDPLIRRYVRNHPMYYVSRGAKGGIMLRSVHDARVADKAAVEVAKLAHKATLEAKVAPTAVAPVVTPFVEPVVVGDE